MKWECVERHHIIANLPSEACSISRRDWRGGWQVFGLAGSAHLNDARFYLPIFPALQKTSGVWAFVPVYRCGAVPDSHRVPFGRFQRKRHQQASPNI